jgi:putative phage-type endonuclease
MSLTEYRDLEQRSDAWYAARCGVVTASEVGNLITPAKLEVANNDTSRRLTDRLFAERMAGFVDPTWQSMDMARGQYEEPRAVEYYETHHSPVTRIGFMVRDDWGFRIGYSPDGLVDDDGLIEVKCPRSKGQVQTILAGEVPSEYVAQIQCGLLVSGREWCDFVSFCGGLPLWTKRVLPDPDWHTAIVSAAATFEGRAKQTCAKYRAAVRGLPMTERLQLVVI